MTLSRDKLVGLIVAAVAAVGLLYAVARGMWLGPLDDCDTQQAALEKKIDEDKTTNRRLSISLRKYAALRDRTYADTSQHASVLVGRRIHELAKQAGLGQSEYTATTFSSRGGEGFGLVGCSVQGRSVSLSRLTNFLYLLKHDHHLRRVTNLEISPQPDKESFNFTLRYVTPVFDSMTPAPIAKRKPMKPEYLEIAGLNTPGRAAYNVVHERNVFKPYRKPYVAPPPRTTRTTRRPPDRIPPPRTVPIPSYDRLVVTGLPGFGDHHEVHLTAPGSHEATVLKVGKKTPVGVIEMVDYRELWVAGEGERKRLSSGRVILKIGKDYWAVERGDPLGKRRLLKHDELPGELRPARAMAPES